jgi:SAM-dependent methyltransferase
VREDEIQYWDYVANSRSENNYISDNLWKRQAIIHRIFSMNWYKKRILEIGVGFGTIAHIINISCLGKLKYIGTDVSPVYCAKAKYIFNVDLINTDILNLPTIEGGFDRVIALDSLEHVRPEDREQGYKNIGDVMSENATMIINIPLNKSEHVDDFDFPFGIIDINILCSLTGMYLESYEDYGVTVPFKSKAGVCGEKVFRYGWTVLKRGKG